jgi:cold shock CspA family protein
MTGRLRFYDHATRWGVVVADEGGLYMLYGQPATGPPLREGERVRFEPAAGPGGARAIGVQRLSPFTKGPTSAAR